MMPVHSTAISRILARLWECANTRTAFLIVVAVVILAGQYAASAIRARGEAGLTGVATRPTVVIVALEVDACLIA